MRSRIAAALALLLVPAAGLAEPSAYAPRPTDVSAVYDFYFGGFRAAEMRIEASFSTGSYQADAEFRTTGFVSLFEDSEMQVETVGRVEGDALAPVRFRSKEREDKGEQFVEVSFSDSGPDSVNAAPSFKDKPWSIDARDQRGVTDPLSAILVVLAPGSADTMCGQRIEAFDGRRRFAFDIGPAENDGDQIRCEGTYVRLAGFKPKSLKKWESRPFELYLKRRPDGIYQVERAVSDMGYGVAIMRLRD